MDDETKFPFLMHKRTLLYVPNNRETREKFRDEYVPITAEQATALSKNRQKAGEEIMRAVVAADNAAAFAEIQARTAAAEPATAPAAPAEETAADIPWGAPRAKKAK